MLYFNIFQIRRLKFEMNEICIEIVYAIIHYCVTVIKIYAILNITLIFGNYSCYLDYIQKLFVLYYDS